MATRLAMLSERDRYWIRHLGSCERSGLTAKAYARRHRLSIHALYQARKRLRTLGALEASESQSSKVEARASRGGFARVEIGGVASPRYRVRLPNGAVVEWEGTVGDELGRVLGAVSQLG